MIDKFIAAFNTRLQQNGYTTSLNLSIPGVRGLLYAFLQKSNPIGPIKFENYYLFTDWENDQFGRLDHLRSTYKGFSKLVNQNYRLPHALRVTLPNLAVVALSQREFPDDAMDFVQNNYFNPMIGGETGQMMLLDMHAPELICHYTPAFSQQGSIPLAQAVTEIRTIFASSLPII
jgi:hypothetical protein